MKKIIFVIFTSFLMPFMLAAQNRFEFEISDGIRDGALKTKMERQVTNLLTMMDNAQEKNMKALNFKNIDIDETAKRCILKMWNNKHLRVWQNVEGVEDYIERTCLKLGKLGYQIRSIPMEQFPVEGSIKDPYTEVYINFDPHGKILDFGITRENNQYIGLIQHSKPVNEADSLLIDHYMNVLSTAYTNKDTAMLAMLYSEDALIITGKRIPRRVKSESPYVNKQLFEYTVKTKQQYLKDLKNVFANNKKISVKFTDRVIKKHPSGNYFSVTAQQEWNGTKYCDLGKIYIIWDYRDKDNPTILVRVWQYTDDPKKYEYKDFKLR